MPRVLFRTVTKTSTNSAATFEKKIISCISAGHGVDLDREVRRVFILKISQTCGTCEDLEPKKKLQ